MFTSSSLQFGLHQFTMYIYLLILSFGIVSRPSYAFQTILSVVLLLIASGIVTVNQIRLTMMLYRFRKQTVRAISTTGPIFQSMRRSIPLVFQLNTYSKIYIASDHVC